MTAVHQPNARDTPEAVHVAILRIVKPGREQEFERLVHQFFKDAASQPGVCGAYLIRPFTGAHSREYGILRSFATVDDRQRFYASDLYSKWNEAVVSLVEGPPRRQELHGMEAFFRDGTAAPPPRWKMAIVTWMGVNLAVYVFSNAIPTVIPGMPMLLSLLLVNAFVVASLTWILMPMLTKIFDGWLRSSRS